jgi:hypothetical protein
MADDLKEHVTARSTWMRLLYMILFIVAFNIAEFVIVFVVLIQFLFKLISGHPLKQLIVLGDSLSNYIGEVVRFLTFRSEDMPYPFGKWPKGTTGSKSATRKSPRKRSARGSTQSGRAVAASAEGDGSNTKEGDS